MVEGPEDHILLFYGTMDNLTPQQRSRTMAAIRSTETGPEKAIRSILFRRGLRFRKNVRSLPGCPDIVFPTARVAAFIDGDFWHGWRFPAWRDRLNEYWAHKIEGNRARDRRNRNALKAGGWLVLRFWGHDIANDPLRCATAIHEAVKTRCAQRGLL